MERPCVVASAITPNAARTGKDRAVHLRENLDSQNIQLSVDEMLAVDGIAPEAV
jgi:hypothetical protein